MAGGIMNLAIVFISVLSLIFALFAPWIMKMITPGFSPEKISQVVIFTRIMFLSPLFLGISGIFGGILTSFKRFLIYSLAPIFYNFGIIVGVLVFVRFMGPIGLAWGVVFGAFLHVIVQYPAARNLGYRHSWSFIGHFSNKEIRKIFRLMIPRTLGIAIGQINLLVITIFASTMAAGSLAIFNFAQNLESVPLGIFGISFSIAVFPTLSHFAAKKDDQNFIISFSQTFRQILFFVIPASVFILLLRAQLVRIILGSGKFDWEDTELTFSCLGILAASLFAQSVIPLLARSFYAMHDTKTPFYIAIVSEVVNIGTVLLLIGKYQILSLAIAFSLSSIAQMMLLLFWLRTRYDNLDDKKIIRAILKIVLATFAAGIGIQLLKYIVGRSVDMDTFIGVFVQFSVSASAGVLIFAAVCHAIKLEEFMNFKKSLSKRLFRERKDIVEDTGEVSGL